MAIKIEDIPVVKAEPGKKQHVKKEQYTNNHLPFPPAQMGVYMKRWRKSFKPTIISWAATIEDPFGTNSMMGKVVKQSWNEVFPELKETHKDETKCAAIIGVVSALFRLYPVSTHKLLQSPRWSLRLGEARSADLLFQFSKNFSTQIRIWRNRLKIVLNSLHLRWITFDLFTKMPTGRCTLSFVLLHVLLTDISVARQRRISVGPYSQSICRPSQANSGILA